MKVILLTNIPKIGQKYDIKEVADGYGRNYLLKQGLAQLATEQEIARIEQKKQEREVKQDLQKDLLIKNVQALEGKEVHMKANANEKGHLFASVQPADIVEAIKQELNIDIPIEYIENTPLKETGEHIVSIQTEGAYAKLKLSIETA